jgi:hypothetical protein
MPPADSPVQNIQKRPPSQHGDHAHLFRNQSERDDETACYQENQGGYNAMIYSAGDAHHLIDGDFVDSNVCRRQAAHCGR